MIYYFSGTGNSEWVAKELGKQLNEDVINIVDAVNVGVSADRVFKSQMIGIVFPVYAWSPPEIVMEFIKYLDTSTSYTFAVCTCGDEAGYAMKILSKKVHLNSGFSIVMPNNYIIGQDVDSMETERKKIDAAAHKIAQISECIKKKSKHLDVKVGKFAFVKSSVVSKGFNKFARRTDSFSVSDACISCGICEKRCPTKTISLKNGKPVWGRACYQCLSCINRCPQKAIEYGKTTINRGRYYFGHTN